MEMVVSLTTHFQVFGNGCFFVQVKIPSVFGSDWETKPEVSSTSEWRFIQLNFRFLNF
jgi:hypothetical protein